MPAKSNSNVTDVNSSAPSICSVIVNRKEEGTKLSIERCNSEKVFGFIEITKEHLELAEVRNMFDSVGRVNVCAKHYNLAPDYLKPKEAEERIAKREAEAKKEFDKNNKVSQ